MNNDDNKLATEQVPQHDTGYKKESDTENNTQANDESSANNHVKTEHTTNADESAKTSNHTGGDVRTEAEKTWHNKNAIKRGIAMLGYGFIAGFVRVGITLIAIFQFFSLLFSEKPNQPLVKFGQNLNTYQYQINQFLTVNSEVYPFPFADWPDSAPEEFMNNEYVTKS